MEQKQYKYTQKSQMVIVKVQAEPGKKVDFEKTYKEKSLY